MKSFLYPVVLLSLSALPIGAQDLQPSGYWDIYHKSKIPGRHDILWQGDFILSKEINELQVLLHAGPQNETQLDVCHYEIPNPSFTESMKLVRIPNDNEVPLCRVFREAVFTTKRDAVFLRTSDSEFLLPLITRWEEGFRGQADHDIGTISGISIGMNLDDVYEGLSDTGYILSDIEVASAFDDLGVGMRTQLFTRGSLEDPGFIAIEKPKFGATSSKDPILAEPDVNDAILVQSMVYPDGSEKVYFIHREVVFEPGTEPGAEEFVARLTDTYGLGEEWRRTSSRKKGYGTSLQQNKMVRMAPENIGGCDVFRGTGYTPTGEAFDIFGIDKSRGGEQPCSAIERFQILTREDTMRAAWYKATQRDGLGLGWLHFLKNKGYDLAHRDARKEKGKSNGEIPDL